MVPGGEGTCPGQSRGLPLEHGVWAEEGGPLQGAVTPLIPGSVCAGGWLWVNKFLFYNANTTGRVKELD